MTASHDSAGWRQRQPHRPTQVLIVDDEPDVCRVLSKLLTHRGLDVAFVTSGAEALEFMRSQPVKVLLLDLMMPGMTGFEVLRSMQDDKQARDLPVVIYSASADPETRQQAQTLGAQAFVAKGSTTFDDLHAVISSFVTGGHSPGGTTLAN